MVIVLYTHPMLHKLEVIAENYRSITQQVFVMQTGFTTVLLIPRTNCLTVLCWPLACLLSRLVYINLS